MAADFDCDGSTVGLFSEFLTRGIRVEEANRGILQLPHFVPMNAFSSSCSKDEMSVFVGKVAYPILNISKQRRFS